jgi:hypothetical protein
MFAFLLQQWLQERASVLRYTYIVRIVGPQSELWRMYMLPLLTLCHKMGVIM